jgi:nucleoside-diphosphate-sugar epimerase
MRILVTGASGFIGGDVVVNLAEQNVYSVIATGRTETSKFDLLPNVNYLKLDLARDDYKIECDACIHCAGLADDRSTDSELYYSNVLTLNNLLLSIKNCKIFIFISSSSVYNFIDNKIKTEMDAQFHQQLSPYGKSKLEAENIVLASGINNLYILRPRAVYGKNDRVLLPRILKLVKSKYMFIPGKLNVRTTLTHIDNITSAIGCILNSKKSGNHVYNIGDDETYNLKSIFAAIGEKKIGSQPVFISIPYALLLILSKLSVFLKIKTNFSQQSLQYMSNDSVLDMSKIKKDFPLVRKKYFYNSLKDLNI